MKSFKIVSIFILSLFVFTITSCDDEPLEGEFVTDDGGSGVTCVQATQNLATASATYGTTAADDASYSVVCNAYAVALQNMIDACGDDTGAIQTLLESLGCPVISDDCTTAQTATTNAETAYNADTTNTTLCNAYKAALQNEIAECGDADGSLQDMVDGLDCSAVNSASLIGAWRIISLTSNGVEELQEELDAVGICYWHEVFTSTTVTDIEYSEANCQTENIIETIDYILSGSIISFTNGDDPVEILELTDTTLRYQDTYIDAGTNYVDIYTYTRQ